jgi:hypothetical protein
MMVNIFTELPKNALRARKTSNQDNFLITPCKFMTVTLVMDEDDEAWAMRKNSATARLQNQRDFAKRRPPMTDSQVLALVSSWPVVEGQMQSVGVLAFVAIFQVGLN